MNPPGEHHSCSLIGCSALLVSRQGGRCGRCAAAQVGSSGGAERSRPLLCDREAAAAAAAAERGGGPYRAVPCRAAPFVLLLGFTRADHCAQVTTGRERKKSQTQVTAHQVFLGRRRRKQPEWILSGNTEKTISALEISQVARFFLFFFYCLFHLVRKSVAQDASAGTDGALFSARRGLRPGFT